MPKRIQRSRRKGWKLPPNTVYIGRPTRWGNPVLVGSECQVSVTGDDGLMYEFGGIPVDRAIAVAVYRAELESRLVTPLANAMEDDIEAWKELRQALFLLKGKDLCCWCPVDGQPCHGDVLLDLVKGL